jgi:hypothetical protein
VARTPLFVAITLAVVIGICLIVGAYWGIGSVVGTKSGEPAAPIEVTRAALTLVAGIGGAVALVVAYRRQRDLEQGRFVERFGAAAAQLGDADVAVRIAGVYAMAGVADESHNIARRQQCIDVLCGYLRLPYDPEQGSSHRTELVTATTRQALPPITSIEEQVHQRLRQNDCEVRQTIVRIIAAHLQANREVSWSGHNYDFTSVLFEDASFNGAKFSGDHTHFVRATFSGKHTDFVRATFSEHTSFREATFSGKRTSFTEARFTGEDTSFNGAAFSDGRTSFIGAAFSGGRTSFIGATFSGESISFESPQAWNNVTFEWDQRAENLEEHVTERAVQPECVLPREWPPKVATD